VGDDGVGAGRKPRPDYDLEPQADYEQGVPRRRLPLTPAWLAGHVAVLLAVVLCVNLGLWQVRRLHQRRAENSVIRARIHPPSSLPDAGWQPGSAPAVVYRGVRAEGRYDPAHEFLVRYRTHEGLPGYGVITPLVTADGVVLVDRGWVPLEFGDRWPADRAVAPAGDVTVTGWLSGPHRSRTKPVAPSPARAKPGLIADVAAAQLRPLLPYDRVYELTLVADGSQDRFPAPAGLPDLSEGPHRSYAFQWFSFAAIALIGWSAIVVTSERKRKPSPAASPAGQPTA
jgi:cytochrome oxidase assembly protein ShyY1